MMIRLEKFNRNFYSTLIAWVDSKEALMQFAGPGFTFPLTAAQLDDSLKDDNRYAFAVIDISSGKHIGHCELYLKENTFSLARILIGEGNMRGKGIGGEIVKMLLEYGFAHFDRRVAELNVFEWNIAALSCYRKAGFTINPGKITEREVNGKKWTALNMIRYKEVKDS